MSTINTHSVTLLRERCRQPYKLVNAHMQALLEHHTSLCTGPAKPTTLSETPDPSKKDTNESNKTVVTFTPATQKSSVNQPPKQTGACLLKTAIATVNSTDTNLEGNILFDEGAQRSFISQEMATKLNFEPNNKERILWIKLSSSQNLTRRCHTVHTIARDKIFITVLIVPKVVPPLQNLPCTSLQQVLHLYGLQIAHPITENENFEISEFISADYYWSFVQDHIVHGN